MLSSILLINLLPYPFICLFDSFGYVSFSHCLARLLAGVFPFAWRFPELRRREAEVRVSTQDGSDRIRLNLERAERQGKGDGCCGKG